MSLRKNLIVGTLLVLLGIMLIPLVLKFAFPELDLIYKVVLIFGIYAFVRQFLGDSTLTLLLTAVLVYFMAFKYGDLFTSLWFITLVLGTVGGTFLVIAAKDFFGFDPRRPG